MSWSSSAAGCTCWLRWLCAASLALGLAGCFLDSAPIRPVAGASVSSSTAFMPDAQLPDVAARDLGTIMTRRVCNAAEHDCLVRCESANDCPIQRACEAAACVDGMCQLDAAGCDHDAGPCAAGQCTQCTPGSAECSNNLQRSCGQDGTWSEAKMCELGCSDGACRECLPGTKVCADSGDQIKSCGPNGRWADSESCENGCANGLCKQCREGAKRCNADAQEQCGADGTWQLAAACSLGCVKDHCAACKIGSYECVGVTDQRVCGDDGEWGAPSLCLGGCLAGVCNECIPGAERCAAPGVQRCSPERRWQTITACPFGCNGSTCAACAEGAIECTSRTNLRVCRDHAWTASDSCRPNAYCDMAAPGGNTCPCDPGYVDPHPSPGLCMPR